MRDAVLRNEMAKVVTIAPLKLVFRFLKHQCPDGVYSVVGPDTDCTLIRKDGIVYPDSGTIQGRRIPPRSLEECQEFFE